MLYLIQCSAIFVISRTQKSEDFLIVVELVLVAVGRIGVLGATGQREMKCNRKYSHGWISSKTIDYGHCIAS